MPCLKLKAIFTPLAFKPQALTKAGQAIKQYKTIKQYKQYIKPMTAKGTEEAFSDPAWLFEIKWDGYRAIADLRQKPARLYSRNGISFAEKYFPIYEALKSMNQQMVLDGEIVVVNEKGLPDFQKLQDYGHNQQYPIFYYVFDLLYYQGENITDKPLLERKALLEKILEKDGIVRYCDHIPEAGEDFFEVAVEKGMEGIMAKKVDSAYYAGKRSEVWLKIRNSLIEETVIGGFTRPKGSRQYFGALILGRYNDKGELEYCGHTGTGFTEKKLKELYNMMSPLAIKKSPFNKKIPVNNPATWIKPQLVCNIKFTEWTKDGIMRHPVFQGLRVDKDAREVRQ